MFAVNTGCREQEVCQLRWDWELQLPEMKTSIFILGAAFTKTGAERVVVLNAVARRVIEARRDLHGERVFTYKGNPIGKLHSSAWKRAWKAAKLPTEPGILKGIHNLRHTFGRRLRSAGISLETRKALLGHANGDITTHYSAAELNELINTSESIVSRGRTETPNLMLIRQRNENSVGNKQRASRKNQLTLCVLPDR